MSDEMKDDADPACSSRSAGPRIEPNGPRLTALARWILALEMRLSRIEWHTRMRWALRISGYGSWLVVVLWLGQTDSGPFGILGLIAAMAFLVTALVALLLLIGIEGIASRPERWFAWLLVWALFIALLWPAIISD